MTNEVLRDSHGLTAREATIVADDISSLAWADTQAGLAICWAGVVPPHGIAMAVGGMSPDSSHGAALAAIYQACLEFACASAVPKFAVLARILDPGVWSHPGRRGRGVRWPPSRIPRANRFEWFT
jgi:alcohol dehydrogenase class IV